MNMREAILAGSRRVAGRHTGGYFAIRHWSEGPELVACALGAAYLGCHPEVDTTPPDDFRPGDLWSIELHRACVRWVGGVGGPGGGGFDVREMVAEVNDTHDLEYDWDEIVNLLPDEVADVEVCDTPDA